jgi:hypothetical protein
MDMLYVYAGLVGVGFALLGGAIVHWERRKGVDVRAVLADMQRCLPEDTWAVGNRVRDLYVKKYGQQP